MQLSSTAKKITYVLVAHATKFYMHFTNQSREINVPPLSFQFKTTNVLTTFKYVSHCNETILRFRVVYGWNLSTLVSLELHHIYNILHFYLLRVTDTLKNGQHTS